MITIIDYGIGNLGSVVNTLNRLEISNQISSNLKEIKKSDVLILPGVGSADAGMRNINERKLANLIINEIQRGKPILGICLGMQLLFEKSEEGNVDCLGVIEGVVKKFKKERKVPQIGWNGVRIRNQELRIKNLFNEIPIKPYFYFVNSYYCSPKDESIVVGQTEYGEVFPSIIVKDNIVATQFHPEKSGKVGQQLMRNIFKYFKTL